MSAWRTSYFECGDCSVKARSDGIEYDRLGYPVCPVCGRARRPGA